MSASDGAVRARAFRLCAAAEPHLSTAEAAPCRRHLEEAWRQLNPRPSRAADTDPSSQPLSKMWS